MGLARLLVIQHCVLMNPPELDRTLRANLVTAMFLTTDLLNEYVDHLEGAFGGLKYLLTGGDVLDPGCAMRLLSKPTPPANLVNVYGPTETTTYASFLNITKDAQRPSASRIGRPVASATAIQLGARKELIEWWPGTKSNHRHAESLFTSERNRATAERNSVE